jgi:hypothetical protein
MQMLVRAAINRVEETYREYPLQSQGYTPRPLVVAFVVGICSTSDDDGSDGPTHL